MTKKPAASQALQNMNKTELAKLDRSLQDLRDAADDAGRALAQFYKDRIKKRGIHLDAYRFANKLNALGSVAKRQAFLVDFDKLRQLHGWDDQKNLFEDDKTAPQKADEAKAKAKSVVKEKPKTKVAKKSEQKALPAPAKAKNGNGHAAAAKPTRVARRGAALFDESATGDDEARPN